MIDVQAQRLGIEHDLSGGARLTALLAHRGGAWRLDDRHDVARSQRQLRWCSRLATDGFGVCCCSIWGVDIVPSMVV
jgi:hypothetical protein